MFPDGPLTIQTIAEIVDYHNVSHVCTSHPTQSISSSMADYAREIFIGIVPLEGI